MGILLAALFGLTSCSDTFYDPPNVSIIKPLVGDTLTAPVAVEVKATGSEIKSVELYLDALPLRSYPFTTHVRDSFWLSSGGHVLEASAKDEKYSRESRASAAFMVR